MAHEIVVENGALNQPRSTLNCVSATKPETPVEFGAPGVAVGKKRPAVVRTFANSGRISSSLPDTFSFSAWMARTFAPCASSDAPPGISSGSHASAAARVRSAGAGEFHCGAAGALRRAISTPFKYAIKPSSYFTRSRSASKSGAPVKVNGKRV